MAKDKKPQLTLGRPADRSLEAFKAFITNFVQKISPGSVSDITDEEWIKYHKDFWADDGEEPAKIPLADKQIPKKFVKKVANAANFEDLSEEEQDKILDRIIDGVDEEAGITTDDEDSAPKAT
jgi:hypothetical protein